MRERPCRPRRPGGGRRSHQWLRRRSERRRLLRRPGQIEAHQKVIGARREGCAPSTASMGPVRRCRRASYLRRCRRCRRRCRRRRRRRRRRRGRNGAGGSGGKGRGRGVDRGHCRAHSRRCGAVPPHGCREARCTVVSRCSIGHGFGWCALLIPLADAAGLRPHRRDGFDGKTARGRGEHWDSTSGHRPPAERRGRLHT